MRVSSKDRLAVNALIDLGLRESAGPVALASISERQHVSLSYLEQLFSRLRRQGLVESTRGPGGGYTLGRAAAQISVADIVAAVDEPSDDKPAPADGISCSLWRQLDSVMVGHMTGISLQSLLDEQLAAGVHVQTRSPRRAFAPAPLQRPLRSLAPNSVFAFGRSFTR